MIPLTFLLYFPAILDVFRSISYTAQYILGCSQLYLLKFHADTCYFSLQLHHYSGLIIFCCQNVATYKSWFYTHLTSGS